MKQTITIEVPEGKTYKQTTDKDGNIIIKYVDKEPIRSKSWEEFCKNHPFTNREYSINKTIFSLTSWNEGTRSIDEKGYLSTIEDAEGILALIQLIRLHDEWVGDWKPDWNTGVKYCVTYRYENILCIQTFYNTHELLCFSTEEMAKEFLNCFKDLIEKAKRFI